MKRVIIDTDPGIDDAAAILMALACPELSVEALTTVFGNGPVDMCTDNARRILLAAGRSDIPVYKGAGRPLLRDPNNGWALHVHGPDALGNLDPLLPQSSLQSLESQHAALGIIDSVMASPGEVTILALGRLTNLALAISLEPRLAQSVAGIIAMGGAVNVPGNVSPVASANLYEDPEAAAIVYRSGAPLVQVGLQRGVDHQFSTGAYPGSRNAHQPPFSRRHALSSEVLPRTRAFGDRGWRALQRRPRRRLCCGPRPVSM